MGGRLFAPRFWSISAKTVALPCPRGGGVPNSTDPTPNPHRGNGADPQGGIRAIPHAKWPGRPGESGGQHRPTYRLSEGGREGASERPGRGEGGGGRAGPGEREREGATSESDSESTTQPQPQPHPQTGSVEHVRQGRAGQHKPPGRPRVSVEGSRACRPQALKVGGHTEPPIGSVEVEHVRSLMPGGRPDVSVEHDGHGEW